MPEFVNGLPLHPLVIHFAVVLIPLSALGAVVIAVWPAARARVGWLVVAAAGVAAVLTPVATSSGKDLARRLPEQELINTHERLGDLMIYFSVPLFVVVLALMIGHHFAGQTSPYGWAKPMLIVAAVLSVGFGVASGVHTYRVGDAGARAVWDGFEDLPVR
jgi:uncharacterized membrane protein